MEYIRTGIRAGGENKEGLGMQSCAFLQRRLANVLGSGFRFRVRGSGFGVQGLGFRVWGLGLGAWAQRQQSQRGAAWPADAAIAAKC